MLLLSFISALLLAVEPRSGRSTVPFFFVSLNTSATGAARTQKLRRAFAGATTHLELVPAVDGNASARYYTPVSYTHLTLPTKRIV